MEGVVGSPPFYGDVLLVGPLILHYLTLNSTLEKKQATSFEQSSAMEVLLFFFFIMKSGVKLSP